MVGGGNINYKVIAVVPARNDDGFGLVVVRGMVKSRWIHVTF